MKTIKLIIFVLIFFIWTNTYSSFEYYSSENLSNYRYNLISSSKWLNYLNKFDVILDKYSINTNVLVKLYERVQELKKTIEFDNTSYSYELENLIYYMDQKLNNLLVDLWVYEWEEKTYYDVQTKDYTDDWVKVDNIFKEEYVDTYKTIIAWDDFIVFSWKTSSLYEAVDVWKVTFYIEWPNASDLKYSLSNANLYLEKWWINSVSSSSIDIISSNKVSLTFDNLQYFIVPEYQVDFRLWIKVNSIWYQKIWKTIKDLSITNVVLSDAIWVKSWKKINAFSTIISVEPFSIVPWVPIVSVISNLNDSAIVRVNIKWVFADNTIDSSNSTPTININKILLNVIDNSGSAMFKLVNSDDRNNQVIWTKNWNTLEFDLNSLNINNRTISKWKWEDYEIYISNTNSLVSIELLKNWIEYDVIWVNWANNLNINLQNSINLWARDF